MKPKTTQLQTSSTLKFNLSTLTIISSKLSTTSTTVWRWKWTKMTSLTWTTISCKCNNRTKQSWPEKDNVSTVEAMMNTAKTLKRIMTTSSPPTKWNKKMSQTTRMKMILMTKKKVLQIKKIMIPMMIYVTLTRMVNRSSRMMKMNMKIKLTLNSQPKQNRRIIISKTTTPIKTPGLLLNHKQTLTNSPFKINNNHFSSTSPINRPNKARRWKMMSKDSLNFSWRTCW